MIGHNGGDPGAITWMFFDPNPKFGYFVASNGEDDLDPVALANLTAALFAKADDLASVKPPEDTPSSNVRAGMRVFLSVVMSTVLVSLATF